MSKHKSMFKLNTIHPAIRTTKPYRHVTPSLVKIRKKISTQEDPVIRGCGPHFFLQKDPVESRETTSKE